MKTHHIVSALRNSASPAARLATWQSRPLYSRRKTLESASPGEKLSLRRSTVSHHGPELSAPNAVSPLLWLSGESDPQIADWTAGRDFLNHRGWFADEFQDATMETYAVTLKALPHLVFYAVKSDGGLRVELAEWQEIDFSECGSGYDADEARREAAKEIIRANDSSTEWEAEESQEYYRKDRVENDISENKETLKSLRHEIRALAHELKSLCPSKLATDYPAAGKAVLASLRTLLAERRELMVTNEELTASL